MFVFEAKVHEQFIPLEYSPFLFENIIPLDHDRVTNRPEHELVAVTYSPYPLEVSPCPFRPRSPFVPPWSVSQISSWSHVLNFRQYFSPFELELKAQTIQLCNDLQSSLFLKLLRLTAKSFLEAFRVYSPL